MEFFKRARNVLGLLAIATLVFAACATPDAPAPAAPAPAAQEAVTPITPEVPVVAPGEEITLEFWSWRVEDYDFYRAQFDIFEARNPGIRVNMTTIVAVEYNTMLISSLLGGAGPDVFKSRTHGGLQAFTDTGYVLPLDGLLPELDAFSDHVLNGARSITTGNVYGVPAVSQVAFVFFNTDIYDELGLSIPQTWGEFLSNLQTIADAGITPIANGSHAAWTLEVMFAAVGPTFYGANYFFDRVMVGETTFEDPVFIAAIDRLNQLTPFMPPMFYGVEYTDSQVSFANGIGAHFIGGAFEAANFLALNPDINFDIFAVPGDNPGDPAYVSTWIDMNFSINVATQHQEAALQLLRFLASQEFGQAVVNELSMISSVPGVDVTGNPYIARVIELQRNTTPNIFLVGFRFESPTGSAIFQPAVAEMLIGEITAADVARQLMEGISLYFEPFQ